ncbi:MAG: hypothetical protein HZY73_07165 [Micropruina sp.]|nr:MAG: hypothetical protein HZY73_07165 [Micropruina sp.]
MTDHRRTRLASWVLAISLLAGCTSGAASTKTTPPRGESTPPTGSSSVTTASATPTPTSTLSTSQTAAVKTVQGYFAVRDQLFDDPSAFSKVEATKALKPFVETDMLNGNMTLFAQLKKAGEHYDGAARLAWISTSGVFGSGVGETVNVTVCRDSTGRTLLDRKGKVLAQVKPAIREFEVRNTSGDFRIAAEKEGFGQSCP